jgi:spore coat protein U-like protein
MRTVIAILIVLVAAARPADACLIDSTSSVSFGSYDVLSSSPLESTGTITYICVVSLSIRIDLSNGGGASYVTRKMSGPAGDKLNYNLYLDAARTRIWGDGTNSTERYGPFVGLLVLSTLTVYGRVSPQQDVRAGAYSDSITVTLNY